VRTTFLLALSAVATTLGCSGGASGGGSATSATTASATGTVAPVGSVGSAGAPQGAGPASGSGARSFPDTSSSIAILADQLPDGMTAAQTQFAATHFVGSQKLVLPITQSLRAINPGFLVLHYHLAIWQSAPSVDFIIDGQSWGNDYPTVTQHEDYFWHDAQGNRVASTADGKLLMNVTDPGFQAYWASSIAQQVQDGEYDGVFADSASPALLQGETTDPQLAGTAASTSTFAQLGGVSWSQAWATWMTSFDATLAQEGTMLIPNVGNLITSWDTTDYSVTHGVFSEGFADPSFATSDWHSATDQLVAFVNNGQIVMLQNYLNGNTSDLGRRLYYLANYLLVKGPRTYLDYFANGPLEWYPEWGLSLGPAQKSALAGIDDLLDPSGVYRRDFQNGVVLVNPSGSPITVSLGGQFQLVQPQGGGPIDASGSAGGSITTTPVTSVSVPATGAVILER
jgi:hypothetical protein